MVESKDSENKPYTAWRCTYASTDILTYVIAKYINIQTTDA